VPSGRPSRNTVKKIGSDVSFTIFLNGAGSFWGRTPRFLVADLGTCTFRFNELNSYESRRDLGVRPQNCRRKW